MTASGAPLPRPSLRLALVVASSLIAMGTSQAIPRGGFHVASYYDDLASDCGAELDSGVGDVGTSDGELGLVTDGTGSTEVSCSVKPSGEGFAVSGYVRRGGSYLRIDVPELRRDATFDAPSVGSIEVHTSFTGEAQRIDDCSFFFVGDQLVDAGKVWATFECPELTVPDEDCAVQRVWFAWELCDGILEENADGC